MDYIDKYVQPVDPEIAEAIRQEELRQNNKLELIASENFVSRAVMAAQGCVMTNKYAEGYPGKRYYGGCEYVDVAEELARQRAKELFGAEHANVQPHSGAQANMAVYFAALNPGDTVMGMNLSHGGHLTHGSPVNFSGKNYKFVEYGVDPQSETIDYDHLRDLAYYDFFLSLIDINSIREGLAAFPLSRYMDTAALIEQLNLMLNDMDFYLWSQWMGKNLYQLIILSTILLGFSSFAREREQETMSFLLSNFSRRHIFLSKILAGGILLLGLTAIGCGFPFFMASSSTYSYTWPLAWAYFWHLGIAAIFLYSGIILFSLLSQDIVKPLILSIFFLILLSLPKFNEALASWYLYRYMTGFDIFVGHGILYQALLIIALLSTALFTLSWRIFKQQDY